MAIGDFCRSTDDCNLNTFFDTALVCFNGTCVENSGGGITVIPTPAPAPALTPAPIATVDDTRRRRTDPCNPNPCRANQLCASDVNDRPVCYDAQQTNYAGECDVNGQNCDSGNKCVEARRTTEVNSFTGQTTTTIFGVCQTVVTNTPSPVTPSPVTPSPVTPSPTPSCQYFSCAANQVCTNLDGVAYDCINGCCFPAEITCSSAGTVVRCADENGTVEISTGIRVNGICTTTQAFSGKCRVCPTPGKFLNCQGTFGNYAQFTPDYVAGPCGIVSVTNDPRCVTPSPVTPSPVTPSPVTPSPVTPSPTSSPASTPAPTSSPASTPAPTSSPASTPAPTPIIDIPEIPVITPPSSWRDCVSEELFPGTPTNRREVTYTGPGGGTCWEPLTTVTFNPSLNEELVFRYQQGSTQFPMAQVINATNASTALSYELQIITNSDITVTPSLFIVPSRGTVPFTVQVTADLLNKLAAGISKLQMSVNIREL